MITEFWDYPQNKQTNTEPAPYPLPALVLHWGFSFPFSLHPQSLTTQKPHWFSNSLLPNFTPSTGLNWTEVTLVTLVSLFYEYDFRLGQLYCTSKQSCPLKCSFNKKTTMRCPQSTDTTSLKTVWMSPFLKGVFLHDRKQKFLSTQFSILFFFSCCREGFWEMARLLKATLFVYMLVSSATGTVSCYLCTVSLWYNSRIFTVVQ